jgi:hypothetical protein
MKENISNNTSHEEYSVQLDGVTASEHLGFVEALKVSLKLRQQYPQSHVKVLETETSAQAADVIHGASVCPATELLWLYERSVFE